MKRIQTESGAEYLWDEINGRFKREGPYSPGIQFPDGEWHDAHAPNAPKVGYPMVWFIGDIPNPVKVRRTTYVTSVVEEPWPGMEYDDE